jgi:nucleoside-diphosphate-sugar epimerase
MNNRAENSSIHTVIGAGQIGSKLAHLLVERGHRVRLVRRSAAMETIPGVRHVRGDITDASFAAEVCSGAEVVYHCANPTQYHQWNEFLLPLSRSIRKAAARSGSRLVVLDNVYMYGKPDGPMREDSASNPRAKNSLLRAQAAEELLADHRAGRLPVTTGRASDFFGPDNPRGAIFNDRFFARLLAGKAVEVLGDPDQLHSYSYTPDVARGLMLLGERDEALGKIWHLPVAAQRTTRELVELFFAAAGQKPRLRRLPSWLLRTMGVVSPLLASVAEMTYQWECPFVVEDSRFRQHFGVSATPLPQAVEATLAHYAHHGRKEAPSMRQLIRQESR